MNNKVDVLRELNRALSRIETRNPNFTESKRWNKLKDLETQIYNDLENSR